MRKRVPLLLIILFSVFGFGHPLAVAEETGTPPAAPSIRYQVDLSIDAPGDVAGMLRDASRLMTKQGEGAVSPSALNRRIRADVETFDDILRSEGYYRATITRRVVPGRDTFQIMIAIASGPRFVLGKPAIEIAGGEPDLAETLLGDVPLKPGAPARSVDIVLAERALVAALAAEGYPFAAVLPRDVVADHATREVAVTYAFDPGPKVVFGEIDYEGLKSVEAAYLDKFITWQPGDLYTQDKVDAFRRRLVSTGLFRSVSVRPERPAPGEARSALKVTVEEAPMRTVSIGAGYSTSEGFGAEVSWEHRNLFGSQERLRLQATGSEIEQSFSAFFTKPHFKRLDQNLNLRSKFGREDTDAFNKVALEGYAGLERKLDAERTATIGLKGEILSIKEDGGHDEYFIISVPMTLFWDASDDPLDPKRGFRILSTIKPSLSLIERNFPYVVIENRASAYWGLGKDKRVVLAIRGRMGSTIGPSTMKLPASERFFSGGGGSVRGFGFQDIGPRDAMGDPTGGRSVAEVGFEIRTRVSETIGLVPFIEGGNVYTSKFPKFSGFRWGAGIGFRYYTSVAPIRLDVAFPINKRAGDAGVQIYVSFGQSF